MINCLIKHFIMFTVKLF